MSGRRALPRIRDRIVDLRRVPAADLLPNPKNWRRHPKAQGDALKGLLQEIGYADALLARETSDGLMLIDGHLRAETTPDAEVPVLVLDLDEAEADKLLLTLDPLAAMAEMDGAATQALLESVDSESEAVQAMLAGLRDDAQKAMGPGEGLTDPDEVPEAEVVSKRGQVWLCGDHRVMCGDSTDADDVAMLMAGEKAELVFADPPYGIGYTPDYSNSNRPYKHERLEGDDAVDARWLSLWASERLYLCTRWDVYSEWETACAGDDRRIRNVIVWDKGQGAAGALDSYAPRHEFLIFATRDGAAVQRTPRPDNVWAIPGFAQFTARRAEDTWGIHLTQKPVALIALAVEDSCAAGAIVADPFLGSGTAMIAAERLGRRCYGMEIEPRYVDVAVKRWEDFTGQKAKRERGRKNIKANA